MAITQAMCNSFKQELFEGIHDFRTTGDTFNLALYLQASASLSKSTTAYTATGEISGTGYTAKGQAISSVNPTLSGDSAVADFADEQWTSSTFTTDGAGIFNETAAGDPMCGVYTFASTSVTAGTFTAQFPAAAAGTAILELA